MFCEFGRNEVMCDVKVIGYDMFVFYCVVVCVYIIVVFFGVFFLFGFVGCGYVGD